jgi:membrane protein implicated in regulation of membrane protease activity
MQVLFWHWWLVALGLLILEVLAPGTFFLWMGVSAALVGVLLMLMPAMGFKIQMFLFALLAIGAILAWLKYRKLRPVTEFVPHLNDRSGQYIGRVLILSKAIENGTGRALVGDTHWRVVGPDLPVGSKVRVVDVDGSTLVVQQA